MSEGIEWAIHCCTVLAVLPEGETLPAAKLAEFHGVPPAYLGKHLQALSRAGLVESIAGRQGGFRLAKSADEISLLDVVQAIEGEASAFQCTEIRQRGPAAVAPAEAYLTPCGIAAAMARAENAWQDELKSVSIADINQVVMAAVHPDQLAAGADWLAGTIQERSNS